MSIRTIIEINHDYIADLTSHPEVLIWALRRAIGAEIGAELNRGETPVIVSGMRVLGQRHHSEALALEVK